MVTHLENMKIEYNKYSVFDSFYRCNHFIMAISKTGDQTFFIDYEKYFCEQQLFQSQGYSPQRVVGQPRGLPLKKSLLYVFIATYIKSILGVIAIF